MKTILVVSFILLITIAGNAQIRDVIEHEDRINILVDGSASATVTMHDSYLAGWCSKAAVTVMTYGSGSSATKKVYIWDSKGNKSGEIQLCKDCKVTSVSESGIVVKTNSGTDRYDLKGQLKR